MATRRPGAARAVNDSFDGLDAESAMPVGAPISQEIDDEELTPADRIRTLIGQSAGDEGTRIKLYRIDPKVPGGMPWCADYSPEEFEAGDLEMIRRQWGPGRYHVRVINRRGIAARVDVTIAEPLTPQVAAPVVNQNSELAQVMRVLAEGQARILDALSTRPDPTADMQRMFTLMAGMREAMGLNNAPAAPAPTSPQALLGDLVGAIKTLREISADVNPPAPMDGDNPLSLVGPIIELVKTARQQPPAPMPPRQAMPPITLPRQPMPSRAPNPAPAVKAPAAAAPFPLPVTPPAPQPAPQPTPESETEMNPVAAYSQIQSLINDMVRRASVGGDVDEAAEVLFEKLPDEAFDYLERENWFSLFVQIAPSAARYSDWFIQVKDRLDAIIAEETDTGDDDADMEGEAPPSPDDPVTVPNGGGI